ncbi:hypothetical protein U9M48_019309 [Paspalum notatum var. saurae]|uniref:DUF4371 domain-containing protein n=1 Tax=Paspalum notatum var. saurae TaxID=547442 RepID=A0AAQ3TCE0_PASNO
MIYSRKISVLGSDGYPYWKGRMDAFLVSQSQDIWDATQSTTFVVLPVSERTTQDIVAQHKANAKAVNFLFSRLGPVDYELLYVNAQGQVIERFLGIKSVADTTSSSLKVALDSMFARHGLSMSKVRGQGYDGASNMRGEFHGLQRRILDENLHAFYIHCFAHQLQLVVVSVAKSCSLVFDFFNIATLIVNTVNVSCKRRDQLSQEHHENIVNQLDTRKKISGRGKNQETSLARPGDTRWGSHHKTLCRLIHMWDAVLEVLENVAEDATVGEKRTTASGLLLQMENFEFILILHLMIRLLAVGLIALTLEKINETRQHGWEELYDEVNKFCVEHHIKIPEMADTVTVRGRSRGRGGQQVTYHHHFKNEIFNVVHDQIIVELNNCFAERSTELLRCIACLDPRNSFEAFDIEKLVQLAKIYDFDFSHYECGVLRVQLGYFISNVRADPDFLSCTDLGMLAVKMVQSKRHTVFSLVYRLVVLALVLPVATATVERAFSAMKIIKTELRNKMGDEWLNHRMVCYIERGVFASITNDDIVNRFQELKTRRKNYLNYLVLLSMKMKTWELRMRQIFTIQFLLDSFVLPPNARSATAPSHSDLSESETSQCKTGFLATEIAEIESTRRGIFPNLRPKSLRVAFIHKSWEQQLAAAMYSASVIDKDTLACLREDQETREVPKSWHELEIDLRSIRQPAWSASENPLREREEPKEYQRPSSGVNFRYLKMRFTA